MENLRKRISVRLVNNEKDFLKYTRRPTHITHKIFGKNFVAIHEIKPVLMLNKPILEFSKWLIYDFHYGFIKKRFVGELSFTTQTVFLTKKNQKMFMKNFLSTNLRTIRKIQSFLTR